MSVVAESWIAGAGAVAAGAVLGLIMCRVISRWFQATDEAPPGSGASMLVVLAAACGAGMLWWWEIVRGGQLPAGLPANALAAVAVDLPPRYLAHVLLFWLLAAATWIDARQRVIPDWITLPGALAGLLSAWSWPKTLLPIMVERPRSFAAPSLQGDVLAWYGGLDAGAGDPFTAAPRVAGLGLAIGIFGLWWAVCTEAAPGERAFGRFSARNALLGTGLLALTAAWWVGTDRFEALQTGLVGLAVSGGLVWTTRAGASHALGREAMGLGDVTLMAMVGAWLGWQACVLTFFLAAFIGLGHGVVQYLRHRENELPFGPSLCLAAAVVVIAWQPLWWTGAVHFEQPGQLMVVVTSVVVLTAITLFVWRSLRGAA